MRLLSSLAARYGLRMRRWDFVAAYLQGELLEDEVVYCTAHAELAAPPASPHASSPGINGAAMRRVEIAAPPAAAHRLFARAVASYGASARVFS